MSSDRHTLTSLCELHYGCPLWVSNEAPRFSTVNEAMEPRNGNLKTSVNMTFMFGGQRHLAPRHLRTKTGCRYANNMH